MKLRWEWRPNWYWDPWEGWYLHDFVRVLMFSEDGTTWQPVDEQPFPTDDERKRLIEQYPAPHLARKAGG